MDLRLIQTNIKHVKKGEDGWYGKYSEYGAAKLYEDLYCGRAALSLCLNYGSTLLTALSRDVRPERRSRQQAR